MNDKARMTFDQLGETTIPSIGNAIHELKDRRAYLQYLIRKKEKSIAKAPEGYLIVQKAGRGKSLQYYRVTYDELRELSYMGASVLHEDTVFPVRIKDIPVNIRNTNAPDDPGTVISREGGEDGEYIISGIAGKPDFTVISIYKNMMNKEIGFVRRALAIIEDQRINFDHIPTGIDSLSMVIESKELEDKLDDVLDAFRQQLKPDEIIVEDRIALIAVVGRRMHRSIGVSARICTALANKGINIKMLNQGTNEINVIIGVEASDFEEAYNSTIEIEDAPGHQ